MRKMQKFIMRERMIGGERILIMMPRVPAWYTALLGTLRIGAVAIPTPNQCTARDVAYRIKATEPVAVIADEFAASHIGEILGQGRSVKHWIVWRESERRPPGWHDLDTLLDETGDGEVPQDPTASSDPLLVFFTSGTVRLKKLANTSLYSIHPSRRAFAFKNSSARPTFR